MNKPLELTVYPPIPPDPYQSGHLMHNEAEVEAWESARYKEDLAKYRKRLTDAELAAEFEAARCDYLLSQPTGYFRAPLGETWPSDHASAGKRSTTLLRFATLPHYDEAAA